MTKPILCVVTSATEKGNTGIPTGFWLSELTHPLKVMKDAGFKTVIASIKGGQAPIDKDSLDFNDPVNKYFWDKTDLEARLANTPSVAELNGADYSAIFFAGGHGTMWDYRENQDAQRLIREVYENDGVVSAVCHGPAALVDAKLSNGEYLVKGKNVAAFTNKEEEEVGGTAIVPYLLESALIEHGAIHHEAPNWSENVYVDGRVNSVAAGATKTPLYDGLGLNVEETKSYEDAVANIVLLGRFAEPDEIAPIVTFLASDKAIYATGGHYAVDGGFGI